MAVCGHKQKTINNSRIRLMALEIRPGSHASTTETTGKLEMDDLVLFYSNYLSKVTRGSLGPC